MRENAPFLCNKTVKITNTIFGDLIDNNNNKSSNSLCFRNLKYPFNGKKADWRYAAK